MPVNYPTPEAATEWFVSKMHFNWMFSFQTSPAAQNVSPLRKVSCWLLGTLGAPGDQVQGDILQGSPSPGAQMWRLLMPHLESRTSAMPQGQWMARQFLLCLCHHLPPALCLPSRRAPDQREGEGLLIGLRNQHQTYFRPNRKSSAFLRCHPTVPRPWWAVLPEGMGCLQPLSPHSPHPPAFASVPRRRHSHGDRQRAGRL